MLMERREKLKNGWAFSGKNKELCRCSGLNSSNQTSQILPVHLRMPRWMLEVKCQKSPWRNCQVQALQLAVVHPVSRCSQVQAISPYLHPVQLHLALDSPVLTETEHSDDDWVVADRHKLVPSVYAGCKVLEDRVSYSGPTFVAIRSGKHDSSTALSHSADFIRMTELEEFREISQTPEGLFKPVLIVSVDGGPDENPRFQKTLAAWAEHFKSGNFDAVFVSTYAPGQSAKNQVERRMAPLSRDLSGLILKHDSFGSHLDSNRRTIDHNLEIRNFCRAGEVLAEVWSDTIIDGEPVVARFVEPNLILPGVDLPSEKWLSVHVRQSQYCLQIVKCEYPNCCKNWRSNYLQWFPNRFLPVPHKIVKSVFGPKPADQTVKEGHFGTLFQQICAQGMLQPAGFERMPFDFYCPSVRSELGKRVCSDCGIYHSSIVSLKRHRKELHNKTFRERIGSDPDEEMNVSMEEEEMDGPAPVDETEEVFPVIDRNIFELIREDFPFEEVQE